MDESLLLGVWKYTISIPRLIWQSQIRGDARLDFMTKEHHQIRNFIVLELPRTGSPLSAEFISEKLRLPLDQVVDIINDLEKRMTFLFRNRDGAVEWAYPVTAAQTPHRLTFSTGEQVNAA